jgi:hypothetical protein
MDLNFHITLTNPPAELDFGLQKGAGSKFEVVQVQRSTGEDLDFSFVADVKGSAGDGKAPDFKSPVVQGPLNGRFVYIDIGAMAGQTGAMQLRLKIPLYGITWPLIEQAALLNHTLTTSVPGTGKNGGPNCATVKPFEGWAVDNKR